LNFRSILAEVRTSAKEAPTAPTLHLSSTILRKASRSTTEEADSEYFSNYLWLFRTRMPMLRRQDLL
jgi:hypothetical protein